MTTEHPHTVQQTREIAISRYVDEPNWTIETNSRPFISQLLKKGYHPEPQQPGCDYRKFVIPKAAITIRNAKSLEKAAKAQRLKNLSHSTGVSAHSAAAPPVTMVHRRTGQRDTGKKLDTTCRQRIETHSQNSDHGAKAPTTSDNFVRFSVRTGNHIPARRVQ